MKTIKIHGRDYVPVSARIKEAGVNLRQVETEVLLHAPIVVIKVSIMMADGRTFTGVSSANPNKLIEKTNPYEVAETSALGRALGFAGYFIDDGIATVEEITKYPDPDQNVGGKLRNDPVPVPSNEIKGFHCRVHDVAMKLNKFGNPYHIQNDEFCNGKGFPSELQGDSLKETAEKLKAKSDPDEVDPDEADQYISEHYEE